MGSAGRKEIYVLPTAPRPAGQSRDRGLKSGRTSCPLLPKRRLGCSAAGELTSLLRPPQRHERAHTVPSGRLHGTVLTACARTPRPHVGNQAPAGTRVTEWQERRPGRSRGTGHRPLHPGPVFPRTGIPLNFEFLPQNLGLEQSSRQTLVPGRAVSWGRRGRMRCTRPRNYLDQNREKEGKNKARLREVMPW